MKVLITGIAGLIGSRLACWILENVPDAEVIGVDDLSCGFVENIPGDAIWYPVSLGSGDNRLDRAFRHHKPDYVFHLAAYAAEGLSPFIRCYNYRNNLLATAEVVNNCLRNDVRRLVFTSSMSVYGRGAPPFDERFSRRPIDPYGVAKSACEQDIEIAGEQHGLDWCIIRPHNVYGPGQNIWARYRNVLGIWMARHLAGDPLLVYGDGQQMRAFSFIDDCLPCLWKAATEPAASRQIINLGGTFPVSIADAAEILCEIMGGGRIQQREARHEVGAAWCTWQKSVDILGYPRTETPLTQGLRAMWDWARDAWDRYPDRRKSHEQIRIEVERGLYSFWR